MYILTLFKPGYKFETVSVLSEPWDAASRETIEARESDVVNNNPQYCSLVRTGIGNIRMLLAGEVDAGMPPSKPKLMFLKDVNVHIVIHVPKSGTASQTRKMILSTG